jgi:multidrug resistance efflux pump
MIRLRLGAITIAVALAAAGLTGCAARRAPRRPAVATTRFRTAAVRPADFRIVLPLTGSLEAERAAPMVNKAGQTQIVSILSDGAWVNAGDVVAKLDASELEKELKDLEPGVAQAEEAVRSAQAGGEKQVENARTGLAKARDSLQLAVTQSQADIERAQAETAFAAQEVQVAQGQLDKRNRLAKERLVAITEVEQAEDELRAKTFAHEKAKRSLANTQQQAERTKHLREIDIQKAELDLVQAEAAMQSSVRDAKRNLHAKQQELNEHQQQLKATVAASPVAGMVLVDRIWDDQGERPLRAGDKVYEDRRLASIIDPTAMRVRCDISEADIERVKVSQPARVVVAAIGGKALAGRVAALDNLARERRIWEGGVPGKKVFAALISLRTQDKRLRPGMSATVAIDLEHVRGGLAVPTEALFALNGRSVVYRRTGGKFEPVVVQARKGNEFEVAVDGLLRAGDRVACEQPPAGAIARVQRKALQ